MTNEDFLNKWTDEKLNDLRKTADPEFDAIAREIFDPILSGKVGMEVFKTHMREMARLDFTLEKTQSIPLSPPMQALFDNLEATSLTAQEKTVLAAASSFFEEYGPLMLMSLFFRSLLKQYAATKAAEILVKTNMLTEFPDRRIKETMQFVLDVMTPGAYEIEDNGQNKPAVYSILKLRLVHAMVRIRIKNPDVILKFKLSADEEPINQEDMILALQSFSIETIEGIKSFGIQPDEEEIENYFQAWKIIGQILGIRYPEGLDPQNYAQGLLLQNKIYERQFTRPNRFGAQLAETTLAWMDQITEGIPFKNDHTIIDLLKAINGPDNYTILRENLQIDLGVDGRELIPEDRSFMEELFHEVVQNILKDSRGGKERSFRIYDGFAASWNIRGMDDYTVQKPSQVFWSAIKSFFVTLWKRILRLIGIDA